MGVFSEMDIEQQYSDNSLDSEKDISCFEDRPDSSAFSDDVLEDPVIKPPASAATDASQISSEDQSANQPANDSRKNTDDEARRKAHEEAEAKRKAEFDACQAAKKAAEQEQLNKLEIMSAEELVSASMKRVSTDTEKLTRRNMKECVAEHIQTMCIEDPDFARKVMHPRKSMIHCIWYINRKAREFVEQELKDNGFPKENGVYGSDVPDDLCYQWAADYFNDPDAKEDHEEEEKFVPKPYVGGTASKGKSGKTAKGTTGDKKPGTPKKTAAKASPKKPVESTGQLSLGDFAMPEEKAG